MVKIIADIGSNWHTIDDIYQSIEKCSELGVHICKFQYFTYEKLYGVEGGICKSIPKSWIQNIAKCCEQNDVEFMCTVFDPADIDFIWDYVWLFKVASPEINHLPMLEAIAKYEESPHGVLISTGCATEQDLKIASDIIPASKLCFMACDSTYPSTSAPLQNLSYLRENYDRIGYSDHSTDNLFGLIIADSFDCEFYEKHFRLTKITGTPDINHSLDEYDWRYMIQTYRQWKTDLSADWIDQHKPFKRIKKAHGFFRPVPH